MDGWTEKSKVLQEVLADLKMFRQDCFSFSKGPTATNLALLSDTILTFLDVIFPSPEMDLITCLSGVYTKKKRTLLSRSKLGLPETWESFVGKKRKRPKD